MIDHTRRLIFVHISRTGGTSIEYACVYNDWWNVESHTKHLRCSQAKSLYGRLWDEYTTFSVVRNPFDRVLSMFACGVWGSNSPATLDTFKFWVENFGPNPNESCNTVFQSEILDLNIDYLLEFSRLEYDFNHMLGELGEKPLDLPLVDAKPHPKWDDFYDPEAILMVETRFKADFERFYP